MRCFITLCLVLTCAISYGQDDLEPIHPEGPVTTEEAEERSKPNVDGFRSVKWGMSRLEVRDAESGEFIGEPQDGWFAFQTTVAGMDARVLYQFIDDELARGGIWFAETFSNRNKYLQNFRKVRSALIDKYGEPDRDETQWLDDLYRDDPSDWGMALATGDLVKQAEWDLDGTNIVEVVQGQNFEITFFVRYTSDDHRSALQRQQQSETESQF